MPIEIMYLGHSGYLIRDCNHPEHAVVIDPFLTGNPVAKHKPEDLKCSHIVISHGHADHFGDDAISIAKSNGATLAAPYEVAMYSGEKGVESVEPMNPGGKIRTPFGFIALTTALHSSSLDGVYMGVACGIILNIADITIYLAADTDLFTDMRLIGEIYKPDIAMLPIGDRFTMGPELATIAAEWINPKVAIPNHYNTFPLIEVDVADFKPKGVEVKVMEPGEVWQYG